MLLRATVDYSLLELEVGDYKKQEVALDDFRVLEASATYRKLEASGLYANWNSINQTPKESTLVSDTYTLVVHKHLHDDLGVQDSSYYRNQNLNTTIIFDERLQRVISKGLNTPLTAADIVSTHHKGAGKTDSTGITDLVSTRLSKMIHDGINITDSVLLGKLWVEEHDNPVFFSEVVKYAIAKSTPDPLTMTEVIVKVLERGLQESAGVTDVLSRNVGKFIADQVNILDGTSVTTNNINESTFGFLESRRDLHKYNVDPVVMAETLHKDTVKQPTDSTQLQEVLSKRLNRTITEYLFLTDGYNHVHTKGVVTPLSQSNITDSLDKTYTKLISDAANVSDTLSRTTKTGQELLLQLVEEVVVRLEKDTHSTTVVTDTLELSQVKRLIDAPSVSDQITREFTKHIIDGIRILDSQDIIEKDISIMTLSVVVSELVSTAISKTSLSSIGLPDEVLLESTKVLGDNITVGLLEYVKRDFVKSLTDLTTFTDTLTHEFKKGTEPDTLTLSSLTKREVKKLIEGTDTIGMADGTIAKAYTPYPKSDTAHVTDNQWVATTLPKSDITRLTENLNYALDKPALASALDVTEVVVTEAIKTASSDVSFTEQITVEVGSSIFNGSVFNSSTLG